MPKVFTAESANRTLPLVRRIVEDMVRQHAELRRRVAECETAAAGVEPRQRARAAVLQREVETLESEIEGYIDELTSLGAEVKSAEAGLIDFPGEIDGRAVYLCWKLGEPSIEYWHELDTGFAGRRPLHSLPASADKS